MQTRILPPTNENLDLAATALRRGEVVAMPTETVYGLAGAALEERALA
jgi:L-threonylcarbamoyladenylate synthase